jgi:hypothetical protein
MNGYTHPSCDACFRDREQHYLDKKVIAMTAKDFKIFERKDQSINERQMELQDTRAKIKETKKEITIER